jgi:alpha-beta hydrolase superfamily lysophospholipase
MEIQEVLAGPLPEGQVGECLLLRTSKGDISGILHRASESRLGVIWVCGARGGFDGPGPGTYSRLAEQFRSQGITSLRLDYRQPNDLSECVLDLLAGIAFFKAAGFDPVVVVGHSFGGAVVIGAGAASSHVKGVVCLSSQTYGAHRARELSPRHLLVVHGKSDTRLPYSCSTQIYSQALEPKRLVLYDGAEHRLEECREELEELLSDWIPATLAAPIAERKL